VRKLAGILFIDHRTSVELALSAAGVGGFLIASGASNFPETFDEGTRSALYISLAGTSAALLGFVLTALAILVALPSGERLDALQRHPKWPRVPSAYFRASRLLLATLVVCTLGVALDNAEDPWEVWEAITTGVVVLALVRVTASVVALDQILAVARAPEAKKRIHDPGP
jgi:hypothetical protein